MEDDKTLSAIGEWPKTTIGPGAHAVIRHAYEQVLDSCARLGAFATGNPPLTEGPIAERQEFLAIDDLLNFSIHARRLIESTVGSKRIKTVTIPIKNPKTKGIGAWKLINAIVHHNDIHIIRTTFQLRLYMGDSLENLTPLMISGNKENKSFPPMMIVKSDQEKYTTFEIVNLIEIFQEKVLSPIIDLCDEQNLFLNNDLA